jgi:hypothetical protein
VKGRLSSYRFRRRLLVGGGTLLVLGLIVGISVDLGNTGHTEAQKIDYSKKAWVYHEPATMKLTNADRRELYTTAVHFISTAVARKHLDEAWEMLGPEMKAGQTRKSWDTGNNNVVPFPAVGIATWTIAYAYKNDVAMDLAVVGDRHSDFAGKTFTLELKRSNAHRWLVAAWVPKGVGGRGQVKSLAKQPVPPPPKAPLSAKWLLAPLSIIGIGVLALIAIGVRNVLRHRRAARRYAELLKPS